MDSYYDRLVREINGNLDTLAESGDRWVASWVANAICNDHEDALPAGEGSEFWLWNAYRNVREMVRKQINARAGDTAERGHEHQFTFPGFDRDQLQDYYMVDRDGEEVGVPVMDLTDAEVDGKTNMYMAMGAACFAHARELQRFKEWRMSASAEGGATA